MLEVDVRGRFGNFFLDARFTARAGLTALFGRSGSGKTSLINLLAGLATAEDGRIAIGNQVLYDSKAGIDSAPEHRRLGYVFQEGRLFPHMSVRGNLEYGMNLVPVEDRHQNFPRVVELLDLESLLRRRPKTLSGGEKQRVAIARALLASPRLLLMDEPLVALDTARKNEILPFIERLRDDLGLPIVYVSHAIDEVIRLADTLVLIADGGVVATGGVEELMGRLDLNPHTGRFEAGAVLSAIVSRRDTGFGLCELTVAGKRLLVPGLDLPEGTRLRLRVRARDVSLSLKPPVEISVLNVLEGVVREIDAGDGPQANILLDIGAPLIARVTRRSVHDLDLRPGKIVHALIKAVAIDRHSLAQPEQHRDD